MAELTEAELLRFRADIGDTTEAFSDAELQALYAYASESYTRSVVYAIDQLIVNAAKFADYVQNQSQEKKKQIFDNLLKVRELWKDRLTEEGYATKTQMRMVGMRSVPPRRKDRPYA